MARLIDADFAIAKITDEGILGAAYSNDERVADVCDMIEGCPTVDAVEVVRCKDCRTFELCDKANGWGVCRNRMVYLNDFCSNGERRSDHATD